jgi:two-component system phosphate regulon sensor histidine kinase PhoR
LRRAQLILILVALVPTVLLTPIGIILLVLGRGPVTIVAGTLVLAFCTSALTGYILGSIFVGRGADLARVQNDFVSTVSHELRTPVTAIRLFVDTLRAHRVEDPAEQQKCLDILDREARRLDGMVGEILELSRIEAGRRLLDMKALKVEDVVQAAVRDFDAIRVAENVEVRVDVQPGLLVRGDEAALTRALGNLLTNGWKYSDKARKELTIRAQVSGRHKVEIAVEDNGPGVPLTEQRAIFEAFERGEAAQESGRGGMGLGLAIVRAIAKEHDGTVELAASSGRGSTFRLLLPRLPPGEEGPAEGESRSKPGSESSRA